MPDLLIEITAGLFPILIDEILGFLILKRDDAGYHWRLWGHIEGRHGGRLSPIISVGKVSYVLLTISALIIPFIFYGLSPLVKTFVVSLDVKMIFLLLAEFSFTGLTIIHFIMGKHGWHDKWKIGSVIIFCVAIATLIFWR